MDKITEKFFEHSRWVYAIEKGAVKGISKAQLYQLTKPELRIALYNAVKNGEYEIAPPHTALIPKDTPGEFRTVYVNEPIDRIFLSIANDLLIELMPQSIHPRCKSYQKGIGCGKVVKEISRIVSDNPQGDNVKGWKADFSKYFDSVPIEFIDRAFDDVERIHGRSAIIDVLRKYYHSDLYFDTDGNLAEKYQSLKQGCSVASYLANVVMYDLDERLSKLPGFYVRYSDDSLYLGDDHETAMEIMRDECQRKGITLNPKKVEYITPDRWFKFLGFSIRGNDISLSGTRIKRFQHGIESRTIKSKKSFKSCLNRVNNYLYKGNGKFSWATQVLSTVNVERDVNELNKFIMDCLRAVKTGKKKVGGLGYVCDQRDGCISRGLGRNVKANRYKTENIDGYLSLGCARKAMLTRKDVYRTLVAQL